MDIQPLTQADHEQLSTWMHEHWGAAFVVGHDEILDPLTMPGFVAVEGTRWLGQVSYQVRDRACEIVTINSIEEGQGIGTALIKSVLQVAQEQGCKRVWLVTTNDNLDALGFYQKRGFHIVAVHPNAVDRARKIKPSIPEIGFYGIPLHDEIELEYRLE